MNKYSNDVEKAVALTKAQMKIQEFLKHTYSYAELMTTAAKAQAQVFSIISNAEPDKKDFLDVANIAEFFHYAINAFELLEPFTEDETGAV